MVLGGRPGHRAIRSGEPPVRIENTWPAIIDRETFCLVQEKMASRRFVAVHPRVMPSFYLLSGLLYCSCGRAMVGRSAKSHSYYYYTCNRNLKQGKDICGSRSFPKNKLEKLVIEQVKEKILTNELLENLVRLVNEELDYAHGAYRGKIEAIENELKDVGIRLARLYDALETGKLDLDDLSPRIKELKARQDSLNKNRLLLEAEITLQGVEHVDVETVKGYAEDLRSLLTESEIGESKAFLRSFVKKIVIEGQNVSVSYHLPLPPNRQPLSAVSVLPIEPLSGAEGI